MLTIAISTARNWADHNVWLMYGNACVYTSSRLGQIAPLLQTQLVNFPKFCVNFFRFLLLNTIINLLFCV